MFKPAASSRFDTMQKQPSILMKQVVASGPTIVEKDMTASVSLTNDVATVSRFTVPEDEGGFYHVSSQVAVMNNSAKPCVVSYYQIGLCLEDMSDAVQNVKSIVCNSTIMPSYSICDGLNTVVKLEGGKQYCLWLNLASSGSLDYCSDCSHLRLYKL